jgi:hypothetical protein
MTASGRPSATKPAKQRISNSRSRPCISCNRYPNHEAR